MITDLNPKSDTPSKKQREVMGDVQITARELYPYRPVNVSSMQAEQYIIAMFSMCSTEDVARLYYPENDSVLDILANLATALGELEQ